MAAVSTLGWSSLRPSVLQPGNPDGTSQCSWLVSPLLWFCPSSGVTPKHTQVGLNPHVSVCFWGPNGDHQAPLSPFPGALGGSPAALLRSAEARALKN